MNKIASIQELSQRLQGALDSNYNVTDTETVLDIISLLEGVQITKEQLEATRLGKYINQLRRKTTDETLARRSKNLVKKWREMVMPTAKSRPAVQPIVNGLLTSPIEPTKQSAIRQPSTNLSFCGLLQKGAPSTSVPYRTGPLQTVDTAGSLSRNGTMSFLHYPDTVDVAGSRTIESPPSMVKIAGTADDEWSSLPIVNVDDRSLSNSLFDTSASVRLKTEPGPTESIKRSDLTFTGKFSTTVPPSTTDNVIINVDSSSEDSVIVPAVIPPTVKRSRSSSSETGSSSSTSDDGLVEVEPIDGTVLQCLRDHETVQPNGDSLSHDFPPIIQSQYSNDSVTSHSTVISTIGERDKPLTVSVTPTKPSEPSDGTVDPLVNRRGRKKIIKTGDGSSTGTTGQPSFSFIRSTIDKVRNDKKKVKTTKELLAGLQLIPSQVIHSAPVSPYTTSTDSQQSNTTSTIDLRSTTGTPVSLLSTAATPEPTDDSLSSVKRRGRRPVPKSEPLIDSLVNVDIERQISDLKSQLLPVEPIDSVELTDGTVKCTCELIEIEPKPVVSVTVPEIDRLVTNNEPVPKETQINVSSMNRINHRPDCSVNKRIVKKSIFDLDYDDDVVEVVPIDSTVCDCPIVKQEIIVHVPIDVKPSQSQEIDRIEPIPGELNVTAVPLLPQFEVIEDDGCPARYEYWTRKNQITKFHVDTLHSCYISNVNGNWSEAMEPLPVDRSSGDGELYERVVPSCNHMLLDRVPKNLTSTDVDSDESSGYRQPMKERKRRRRKWDVDDESGRKPVRYRVRHNQLTDSIPSATTTDPGKIILKLSRQLTVDGEDEDEDGNGSEDKMTKGCDIDENLNRTDLELDSESSTEPVKRRRKLPIDNNYQLDSFNELNETNRTGMVRGDTDTERGYLFKEWHEVVHRKSYNNELLTILPYVVID